MTKVGNNDDTSKKFIPGQVGVHNYAIDVLTVMQRATVKISEFKKQIENVDADIELMNGLVHADQIEIRAKLVYLHDWKVLVYRRILAYYLNQVKKLYDPLMYHHMDMYPKTQPNALTNVKAA